MQNFDFETQRTQVAAALLQGMLARSGPVDAGDEDGAEDVIGGLVLSGILGWRESRDAIERSLLCASAVNLTDELLRALSREPAEQKARVTLIHAVQQLAAARHAGVRAIPLALYEALELYLSAAANTNDLGGFLAWLLASDRLDECLRLSYVADDMPGIESVDRYAKALQGFLERIGVAAATAHTVCEHLRATGAAEVTRNQAQPDPATDEIW